MIKITFPDGSVREFRKGVTSYDIASSISPRLAAEVYAATVNGEIRDLSRPVDGDSTIKLHKWDDPEAKHAFWHSSAHLMAEALEALFPGIKFGIGPAVENGFYYDVDPGEGKVITDADLPLIEDKMKELAARNSPIVRTDVSKKEAMDLFSGYGFFAGAPASIALKHAELIHKDGDERWHLGAEEKPGTYPVWVAW